MVEIEAWVNVECGANDIFPDKAVLICGIDGCLEFALGREGQYLIHVLREATLLCSLVDGSHEGFIKGEDVRIVIQVRHSRNCNQQVS